MSEITRDELVEKIRANCVTSETGCHEWQGGKSVGYGRIWDGKRTLLTHRVMYEDAKGPIPKGFHTDHLCRNPACCNPDHLEAVTPSENARRGKGGENIKLMRAAIHHCAKGHPLTEENTAWQVSAGHRFRRCRTCARLNSKMQAEKMKAKGLSHRRTPEGWRWVDASAPRGAFGKGARKALSKIDGLSK